jgi:hypothetical protein
MSLNIHFGGCMLKQILGLFLTLAIFSTSAFAAGGNGLKAAVDELNYALTVEWDQKDPAFYQASIDQFLQHGFDSAAMVDFLKSRLDGKTLRDLEQTLAQVDIKHMSVLELQQRLVSSQALYARGASWEGDYVVSLALGLLALAVLVMWLDYMETGRIYL